MTLVLVFLGTAALDWAWTAYIVAAAQGRRMRAALYSSTIVAVSAAIYTSYVKNPWTIAAGVAGAFVGTYLSVRRPKPL